MKIKKIAAFIIPLFFCTSLFCEVSLTGFSFSPEFGFLNGKIVENVWYVNRIFENNTITLTPTDKMSRLDWQLNNAFFFGAQTTLTFNKLYTVDFSFKNAMTADCGIMEDYDWMNPISWPNDPKDEITNYSKHTNHLNSYTLIDFTFGKIFYLDKENNISITPRAGFEVETIYFSGIGGWKTYKSDNWSVIPFNNEKVISYSQAYIAPILIINADFNFARFFEFSIDLSALRSEKMTCIDHHHAKNKLYNDRIENVWKFSLELGQYIKFLENHKIGIKGNISFIPDSYGFTYSSTTSNEPDLSSIGGTSRFLWSYSVVYSWYF